MEIIKTIEFQKNIYTDILLIEKIKKDSNKSL